MATIKKTDNEKDCSNCEYYLPHYIIRGYDIRKSHHGHCRKNLRLNPSPCKHYAEKISDKTQTELSLKKVLQKMSKQLETINLIIGNQD